MTVGLSVFRWQAVGPLPVPSPVCVVIDIPAVHAVRRTVLAKTSSHRLGQISTFVVDIHILLT